MSSDENNANVWDAAAGARASADVLWTFDAARFKAMLKAALAA